MKATIETRRKEDGYYVFAEWDNGMSSLYEGDRAHEIYDMRECSNTTYAGRTHIFFSKKEAIEAYKYYAEILNLD